jgi:hypothetical protein
MYKALYLFVLLWFLRGPTQIVETLRTRRTTHGVGEWEPYISLVILFTR